MKTSSLAALIIILLIPLVALALYKGNKSNSAEDANASQAETSEEDSQTNSTSNQNQNVTKAADLVDPADATSAKQVILKTNKGDIRINLYDGDSPKTVKNFVTLGKRGYYSGVTFHRVIQDFMIQGGDPTGSGAGGESIFGKKFPDEFNTHKIVRGSVAMANAGANTNGSQFFIVTEKEQTHLDGHHTNFGQVADEDSMKVVAAIAAVPVDANDKPTEEVKITGFEIVP